MNEFTRFEMLVGEGAVHKIMGSHVAVFGLGGVGSFAVEALARCGVGKLTLIDNDTISLTNINRQLFALHSTLGQKKTEAAKKRVLDINPCCTVITIDEFYLPDNRDMFFDQKYDYIIDAIDTVTSKIDLAVKCNESGLPLISSMGTGNKLNAEMFLVSDIYETHTCPLCRVVRKELKERGIPSLKVVYSPEEIIRPISDLCEEHGKRQTPASASFVPPVAGMLLAGEVIKELMK
ncbi:MAG: tRNA threonylcarbamoyladenosine dehydratase [Oscillospiraceae bacterium]|jgi:tRNA A37 threonylcarbamoyladenosine dehydratase|nr:tRNA threonylcarbamoyladenosine dehydratase [Oscillospiraceae bacterium]